MVHGNIMRHHVGLGGLENCAQYAVIGHSLAHHDQYTLRQFQQVLAQYGAAESAYWMSLTE